MSQISTQIIQMNSHYVLTGNSITCFVIGGVLFLIGLISCFWIFTDPNFTVKKWLKGIVITTILLGLGFGTLFYGFRIPKQQIIKACANGPVSIEQLSSVYDIKDIDGKELTLIVR